MLGTSEQTAKISKTGFTEIGRTAVSKPNGLGFQVKKTGFDKFESYRKFYRKWGTLKTLVHTAYETCSTDQYLWDELKHIWGMFNEINNCPHWVISKVIQKIKNKQAYQCNISQDNNNEDQNNIH